MGGMLQGGNNIACEIYRYILVVYFRMLWSKNT